MQNNSIQFYHLIFQTQIVTFVVLLPVLEECAQYQSYAPLQFPSAFLRKLANYQRQISTKKDEIYIFRGLR